MTTNSGYSCNFWCWAGSLAAGILVAALLMIVGGWSFLPSVLLGLFFFVVLGFLLTTLICSDESGTGVESAGSSMSGGTVAAAGAAGVGAAAMAGTSSASDEGASAGAGAVSSADQETSDVADAAASESAGAAVSETTGSSETAGSDAGSAEAAGSAAGGIDATTSGLKPSASLPGQDELASRKGTWKYEGGSDAGAVDSAKADVADTAGASAAADVAAETAAAPAAKATSSASPAATADVSEAAQTKPELLTQAREGGPDDLKQIKGVGPQMENMMHGMGVFHFDQVAGWSPEEAAWVDANLPKFKGRIARDGWVEQAKILAAGGVTEFSKKVEKGGVY